MSELGQIVSVANSTHEVVECPKLDTGTRTSIGKREAAEPLRLVKHAFGKKLRE